MAFIRKIKRKDSIYLAEVENYREEGKVKQRVIRYIGKEEDGEVIRTVKTNDIEILSVKQYLDYKVLHTVAGRLGLTNIFGKYSKYILLMVYTQIVSRKSLYRLPEYTEKTCLKELLGIDKIIDKHLYLAIDHLEEMDFKKVEREIIKRLKSKDNRAFVLDITDTYFSGSRADWKARRGKDNQYSKLIQIALAVTQEQGFPILHKVYEGNINGIKILEDIITEEDLKGYEIILLDRGMTSYGAIRELRSLGYKIIAGMRMNKKLKTMYLSQIDREDIFQIENQITLKNTKVYHKTFDFEEGKLTVIYNPEIEITKRMKAMEDPESYNREEAKYLGYSLIYNSSDIDPVDAVKKYYERDIVEKAFRELKTSINLNPVRKYRLDHVQAHIKICYLAYAILSYIHDRLRSINLSAVDALDKLQSAYKVELKDSSKDFNWTKVVTLTNEQKRILNLLDCSV